MRGNVRRWWPALKAALAVAILVAIGRRFAHDLRDPDLWRRPLHPGWLALSGLLYLAGIGLSAVYWQRLLGYLGPRPPLLRAARAYYVGHLGKYLPGKAWALFLRAGLVRPAGVRLGLATLTSFYEVLTTMASGALVAAVLFALLAPEGGPPLDAPALRGLLRLEDPPGGRLPRRACVLLSLGLMVPLALPLLPPLFNRLARRLAPPADDPDPADPPRLRLAYLAEGVLLTSAGWLLLGASLAATLRGLLGPAFPGTPAGLGRLAAVMGLSYVAGFVVLVAPSGLGVREFFLVLFLRPELAAVAGLEDTAARGTAVLAVLVLRLVWTAAELVTAAVLYALPEKALSPQPSALSPQQSAISSQHWPLSPDEVPGSDAG